MTKTEIKPVEYITSVECTSGGSIAIYRSKNGMPILRSYNQIASEIVNVEIRDDVEVELLIETLRGVIDD